MSKHEKRCGIMKPADVKRIDKDTKPHKKTHRNKKEYPPHWQVRQVGDQYLLYAYRVKPCVPFCWRLGDGERPNRVNLEEYLSWYESRFPQTASLPVRFISCQPVECGREVLV